MPTPFGEFGECNLYGRRRAGRRRTSRVFEGALCAPRGVRAGVHRAGQGLVTGPGVVLQFCVLLLQKRCGSRCVQIENLIFGHPSRVSSLTDARGQRSAPRVFRAHRGRGGRHRRYKPRTCRQCRPAVPSGCGTTRTASTWRIALLGSAGPLSWCVISSLRGHRISPAIWASPRPPCVCLSTGPSAPGTCVASRTPRIAARWPARSPAPLWGRRATARDTRRPHRPRWGRLTLCGEKSTDPRGIGDLPVHWSQKSLLLLQ